MRLPLKRRPMGRIERINMSFVRWISFAPSRRRVVRCSMRVPAACITILDPCEGALGGDAHGKSKVEGDEEDGEPEVEGVVQVVVVDDD